MQQCPRLPGRISLSFSPNAFGRRVMRNRKEPAEASYTTQFLQMSSASTKLSPLRRTIIAPGEALERRMP